MHSFKVVSRGVCFDVRVVECGERFGRTGSIVHNNSKGDPLVEFYDAGDVGALNETPQYVTSYMLSTLTERPMVGALALNLGEKRWHLTREATAEVVAELLASRPKAA